MIAALQLTPYQRRQLDRDHQIADLVEEVVNGCTLSPRREAELRQAGADRLRRAVELLEEATLAAAYLEREERSADAHVQINCSWCSGRRVLAGGICGSFRAIRRSLDRCHRMYRRTMRRLEHAP